MKRSGYPYGIEKKGEEGKKIDKYNMSFKGDKDSNEQVGDKQYNIKNVNPPQQNSQKRVIGLEKNTIKRARNNKRTKAIYLPKQYLRNGIDKAEYHVKERGFLKRIPFENPCPLKDKKEEKKHECETNNFAKSKDNNAKAALRRYSHAIFRKEEKYSKIVFHNFCRSPKLLQTA